MQTRKRKAQVQDRSDAGIDAHIPLPKMSREQKAGKNVHGTPQSSNETQNTRIKNMQADKQFEGEDDRASCNCKSSASPSSWGVVEDADRANESHEQWRAARAGAGASSAEKTSDRSSTGGGVKDASYSSSEHKRCNAGHLTGIRASQKGVEQQGQARDPTGNSLGSSIGAKNTASRFDPLDGRSSWPQQKTEKLQKCDYCKQRHKAEDLRSDSLLTTACPSFARLKPTDQYCGECIEHLRSLYAPWLPR